MRYNSSYLISKIYASIQAESVTYHLSAPVLRHKVFKPSYSCITSIRNYFSSLPKPVKDEELIVVGDRIFTDIVLANRMSRRRSLPPPNQDIEKARPSSSGQAEPIETRATRTGPLSIWTTGVWQKESMKMRYLEKSFMQGIQRYIVAENGLGHTDVSRFMKELPPPSPTPDAKKNGLLSKVWGLLSRAR